ncbi:MAG: hypothetical protein KF838_12105 [Phycisphaeraceae bacterium]|nr:MAG: hypothetical protein KF838_12105 [Phycisphaeraceae bacterium]
MMHLQSTQRVPAFEEHLTTAFQRVRRSIGSVLDAALLDAAEPQEMARRLGVNRNLTWKVSKVLGGNDLYQSLQHLPGAEGIEILLKAARKAGVAETLLESVREAQRDFDKVVEIHTGDRATLDLILDSMGSAGAGERLEHSRKLAFRGNSGVWGLQARVRCTTSFIAPNRENPDLLDLGLVGGLVDVRRLRANIRWPLFRPSFYNDDGTPASNAPGERALDPAYADSPGPKLLGAFCSPNMPEVHASKTRRGWVYELMGGPIGNTGAFTCFFGTLARGAASRWRTEQDTFAELGSQATMPTEMMQFDLIAHRDLDFLMTPRLHYIGHLHGNEPGDIETHTIPVHERPAELSGVPPVVGTSLIPRYDEMVAYTMERAGWDMRDFRAIRLAIKYPPMHSSAVLRAELPRKP